jgi:hypothetical protein
MGTSLGFLTGMTTMGFLIASLFFFRFWRRTGDVLFLAFATAFLLFAIQQGLITLSGIPREERSWTYFIRLVGFGLIISAVVAKNMARKSSSIG